eukprot:2553576-Rhodomonas_salina.3
MPTRSPAVARESPQPGSKFGASTGPVKATKSGSSNEREGESGGRKRQQRARVSEKQPFPSVGSRLRKAHHCVRSAGSEAQASFAACCWFWLVVTHFKTFSCWRVTLAALAAARGRSPLRTSTVQTVHVGPQAARDDTDLVAIRKDLDECSQVSYTALLRQPYLVLPSPT